MRTLVGMAALVALAAGCGDEHANIKDACMNAADCGTAGMPDEWFCYDWVGLQESGGKPVSGECFDKLAGDCRELLDLGWASACLEKCSDDTAWCIGSDAIMRCTQVGDGSYFRAQKCTEFLYCGGEDIPVCSNSNHGLAQCTCYNPG